MRTSARLLVAASAALAVSLTLNVTGTSTPPVEGAPTPSYRYGDRLYRYVGIYQTQETIARIDQKVQGELDSCYAEHGVAAVKHPMSAPDAALASRDHDLASFRAAYGYGRTLESVNATAGDPSLVGVVGDPEVTAVCEGRASDVIDAELAPLAVHRRVEQLEQAAFASPAYRSAARVWGRCMRDAGEPVVEDNPRFGGVDLVDRAVWDAKLNAAGVSAGKETVVLEHVVLTARAAADLQEVERQLFDVDSVCLVRSGAATVLNDVESQILAIIVDEFPDFDGVN